MGDLVPWSVVKNLRQRLQRQRLEMFSADGELLGMLEYLVDHVDVAFRMIVDRVPQTAPVLPVSFRRRPSWLMQLVRIGMFAMMAIGLWAWWSAGEVSGILIFLFAAVLSSIDFSTSIRAATVTADGVILQRPLGRTQIPWGSVSRVSLDDVGAGSATFMSVRVHLRDGVAKTIVPEGADVFSMYAAATCAHSAAVKGAA